MTSSINLNTAISLHNWLISLKDRMSAALRVLGVAIIFATGVLAGCTDSSIARARRQMANGNYAAAHQYFATEATKSGQLSEHQRQLVMDGLCTTESEIGAPTYPLARQFSTCEAAVNLPGSESGETFARVARKQRESLATAIDDALAQQDIARADDAILRYRAIPGSDPRFAADRTRRLWTIVNREATPRRASLSSTISQVSHQFRREQNMSDRQFRLWVENSMTVDGSSMVSNVEVGKHTLGLWLDDNKLASAALNLDRFARVNDGLVARCHCDGRTEVALKDSGLPAYLVRLDPASHNSEVLILDQP